MPARRATYLFLAALLAVWAGQTLVAAPVLAAEPPRAEFRGRLILEPDHGPVGTRVTVRGEGFEPGAVMDLLWRTVDGRWEVANGEFHGRRFTPVSWPLAKVTADSRGAFTATFTVPEDYGFSHDVMVVQDGVIRNKALFNVDLTITMHPTSGPPGTPITLEAKGIGWQLPENSWLVIYDNRFTGWLSAVTTRGTARAVIPAAGRPGTHVLRILNGPFTFPYMNLQQSPFSDFPTFTFRFEVTDGDPVLPPPASRQGLAPEPGAPPAEAAGPVLWTDPRSGPVGTPISVYGRGFPPGSQVQLTWYRLVGNRVSGKGWREEGVVLGAASADDQGTFRFPLTALDDLGGPHRIEARASGGVSAATDFAITPSAFDIEPSSGPAGTVATIHLKGVGWTETANIYTLVYDNGYVGYACGFNSQGDVTIYLPMTGEPGWHFIGLYPGIYKGKDAGGVENSRIPQLTYADDHPGEKLPAFRFAFRITEPNGR
ncbi:MAG: hypothetical protein AB1609_14165 [Bacillota bacterium]